MISNSLVINWLLFWIVPLPWNLLMEKSWQVLDLSVFARLLQDFTNPLLVVVVVVVEKRRRYSKISIEIHKLGNLSLCWAWESVCVCVDPSHDTWRHSKLHHMTLHHINTRYTHTHTRVTISNTPIISDHLSPIHSFHCGHEQILWTHSNLSSCSHPEGGSDGYPSLFLHFSELAQLLYKAIIEFENLQEGEGSAMGMLDLGVQVLSLIPSSAPSLLVLVTDGPKRVFANFRQGFSLN